MHEMCGRNSLKNGADACAVQRGHVCRERTNMEPSTRTTYVVTVDAHQCRIRDVQKSSRSETQDFQRGVEKLWSIGPGDASDPISVRFSSGVCSRSKCARVLASADAQVLSSVRCSHRAAPNI